MAVVQQAGSQEDAMTKVMHEIRLAKEQAWQQNPSQIKLSQPSFRISIDAVCNTPLPVAGRIVRWSSRERPQTLTY